MGGQRTQGRIRPTLLRTREGAAAEAAPPQERERRGGGPPTFFARTRAEEQQRNSQSQPYSTKTTHRASDANYEQDVRLASLFLVLSRGIDRGGRPSLGCYADSSQLPLLPPAAFPPAASASLYWKSRGGGFFLPSCLLTRLERMLTIIINNAHVMTRSLACLLGLPLVACSLLWLVVDSGSSFIYIEKGE